MNLKLILFTVVLLSLTWKVYSQTDPEQLCQGAQESCRACLLAHPECAWCSSNATASSARCRLASVTETQCPVEFTQSPMSNVVFTRDNDFSMIESSTQNFTANVTQLRPQAAHVQIRQGDTQVVNITFRRVVDYPLDLYYVMDLSNSMRDDLQTLQTLGISLASDIRNVTGNFRLGFGTFVDKPMMPYASTVPELLQDPCLRNENETCAPVFGFRHQLPLTDNYADFELEVNKTEISGNIDSPEGGFDALMQIAVCEEQIGWNDDALRVIIFTTDASSHIAMDGKLAAILEANDMQCHLEQNPNTGSWLYSESRLLDYPSIGQLKRVFEANKIQTIFAVTSDVRPLYLDLEDLLDSATVPELNSDSSNVVEIIRTQYDLLRSEIQLNPPNPPSNINMRYRAYCPGGDGRDPFWNENSLECLNVGIGEEVVFQFLLTATGCPNNPNQIDTMNITSAQVVDRVAVTIEYISCECGCFENRFENSSQCSGAGTFECGLCYCNEGATGQQCQCTALSNGEALESTCVDGEFQDDSILCNNLGSCECGVCSCDEGVFGDTCECTRNGCPNDCGGLEQGTCHNCNGDQRCQCNENRGWTRNPRIGDCSCNDDLCRAPNRTDVCSENGVCDCDECVCDSFLSGRFCNRCEHPRCTGIEDGCNGLELRECAECVYEANRVGENAVATVCNEACTQRNIRYVYQEVYNENLLNCETCTVNCESCAYLSPNRSIHIPVQCRSTHLQTECDVTYKIFWNSALNVFTVYVRRHNVEEDCPGNVDPLLIVLPVVGGIVLLGLIALILWKIFQTIRDKHEFEQFLEEQKRSQWKTNENPLFEKPTDRIENPAYIGAN